MTSPDCDRLRDMAAELAVGVLDGSERAAALRHLARCAGCRGHVVELSAVVDELFLAVPDADPPVGFETRVLRGVRRSNRPGRRWLAVAATVFVVVAMAGGLVGYRRALLGLGDDIAALHAVGGRAVHAGPMLDQSRRRVGEAFVYDGRTPFVFVAIAGWGESGRYDVELVLDNERHVQVAPIDLDRGSGSAGGTVTVPVSSIRAVWVTDADHEAWCSFRL